MNLPDSGGASRARSFAPEAIDWTALGRAPKHWRTVMKKDTTTSRRKKLVRRSSRAASAPRKPEQMEPKEANQGSGLTAFFGVENIERVFGLCEQVLERRWSVSELEVPYRWINYWDRERLLMDIEREGSGWRKFSFIDYVWVRIVCELRAFGATFDAIRRVKETLAASLPIEPELAVEKSGDKSSCNVLLLLIAEAVVTKAPIHLLIRSDGETLLFNESHAGLYGPELDRFRAAPHLCVPLTGMLGEIIRRNAIDFIVPKIPLLASPEVEVLALLRESRLTELLVVPAANETPRVIIREGYDPAEAERALLESMMLRPYWQIRYETKDGKSVAFHARVGGGK